MYQNSKRCSLKEYEELTNVNVCKILLDTALWSGIAMWMCVYMWARANCMNVNTAYFDVCAWVPHRTINTYTQFYWHIVLKIEIMRAHTHTRRISMNWMECVIELLKQEHIVDSTLSCQCVTIATFWTNFNVNKKRNSAQWSPSRFGISEAWWIFQIVACSYRLFSWNMDDSLCCGFNF